MKKEAHSKSTQAQGDEGLAVRVSVNSIMANALLSAFKLIAGITAHSGAMLSDAVHSLSDVLSTIVVIVGVKIAGKDADEKHQYGHERMESVAAILLAVMLAATGVFIGYGGIRKIMGEATGGLEIPGLLALVAAVVSIAVKEGMYWYTRRAARQINSGALMADAWHHRSDALSSVGSFVGIFGARLGYPVLDPIASVVICAFITKAAVDIFRDAISKMTDEACDGEVVGQIEALVAAQPGVRLIDGLQTRKFGNKVYVDVEIAVDGSLVLRQAHEIAQRVHDAIERDLPQVKHCMVHVNPAGDAVFTSSATSTTPITPTT